MLRQGRMAISIPASYTLYLISCIILVNFINFLAHARAVLSTGAWQPHQVPGRGRPATCTTHGCNNYWYILQIHRCKTSARFILVQDSYIPIMQNLQEQKLRVCVQNVQMWTSQHKNLYIQNSQAQTCYKIISCQHFKSNFDKTKLGKFTMVDGNPFVPLGLVFAFFLHCAFFLLKLFK